MPGFAPRIGKTEKARDPVPRAAAPVQRLAAAKVQRPEHPGNSVNRYPGITAQLLLSDEHSAARPGLRPWQASQTSAKLAPASPGPNRTGLPDRLKQGVEGLSGLSLQDVRVHYNSPRPAQLRALAFTQGRDIHVAAGQERHLPHEAWHVVQQKQGRVQPTLQMRGTSVNDDTALEREADAMGALASRSEPAAGAPLRDTPAPAHAAVQRRVGFEFETGIPVRKIDKDGFSVGAPDAKEAFYERPKWHIEPDSGNMEFVSDPLTSSKEVFETVDAMTNWVRDLQNVKPEYTKGFHAKMSNIDKSEHEENIKLEEHQRQEEESRKTGSSLKSETVIGKAVEKLKVKPSVAEQWIETYGIAAVNHVTENAKPEDSQYFDMILGFSAKQFGESAPPPRKTDFDESRKMLIELNVHRRLDNMKQTAGLKTKDLAAFGSVSRITAAPQATMGIPLDDLIDAMHLIPKTEVLTGINTSGEKSRTLTDKVPDDGALLIAARRAAIAMVKPYRKLVVASEKQWRELEGLSALVISYIMSGQQNRYGAFAVSKYIAPLMSRLDFGTMFAALAPKMQDLFTPTAIAAASATKPGTHVFGPKGFGSGKKGPTVEEWVDGIRRGSDPMSAAAKTAVTDDKAGGASSMGEFTEFDKTDKRAPGGLVPLELRRIPGQIPLEDWSMLAYQIFVAGEALIEADFY